MTVSGGAPTKEPTDARAEERCACGAILVACEKCGDSRCLKCDPYEDGETCGAALAPFVASPPAPPTEEQR